MLSNMRGLGGSTRSLFETHSVGRSFVTDEPEAEKEYPNSAEQYQLLEEAGRGVSATVWKARCIPYDDIVAVKQLDLENVNVRLEEIAREASAMKNFQHANVLTLNTSFVHGRELWMVMPFMSGGSMLNIIKYKYPEGIPEPLIAIVLREVLKGMDYLHKNNTIHRDVKAGNILVGRDGRVLLGDFGVVAQIERGDFRKTFVGTPCWMAPEVMEQTEGYNTSADIWSFGITMLELAHGSAPFARYPPMKVLLMTLQNPPPTLEESGNRHFSKAMKEVVQKCLNKDPNKRPTAAQLMEMRFFKNAGKTDALVDLVSQLPDLTERVKQLNQGKVAQQYIYHSNEDYLKGVSSWDFNVDALKQQAEHEPLPPLTNLSTANSLTSPASKLFKIDGSSMQQEKQKPEPVPATPTQSQKSQSRKGRFTITHDHSPVEQTGAKLMEANLGSASQASNPATPTGGAVVGGTGVGVGVGSGQPNQSSSSTDSEPKVQPKSRFKVVQEDSKDQQSSDKNKQSQGESARKSGGQFASSKAMSESAQQGTTANALDKIMQQAIPRLQEIQEAQRTLADAHNSLLAAINEAQKGKKEMLAKYVAHPYVKVISGKQLQDFDQIREIKTQLSYLQDENRQLRARFQEDGSYPLDAHSSAWISMGNGQQSISSEIPQNKQTNNNNDNLQKSNSLRSQ